MAVHATDHRHRHIDTAAWLLVALILQVGASRWYATDVVSVDYFALWTVPATVSYAPNRDIYSHDNQRAMADAARTLAITGHASPAQKLAMGVSDQLYAGRIDATGSPLAYTLIGVTSTGQYDTDLGRFTIASFIAFLTSIALLCRLLGFSPTATAIAAAAYSLCFAPTLAEVRVVNVNQWQLLVLSGFLWLNHRGRPALAGAVLGFGIMFKPNIAAVALIAVLVMVIGRRVRENMRLFAGVGAGVATGVVASAAFFGTIDVWRFFLASVGRTLQNGYPLAQGNFGMASLIATLWGSDVSLWLAGFAITAVLAVLWRTRRPLDTDNPSGPSVVDEQFLIVGMGCTIMLLASRLVWLHYYVLLIPLSLYLLRPSATAPNRRFGPVAAGLALLLLSPAAQAISTNPLHISVMANIATSLLFVAGLHSWWTVRNATGGPWPLALADGRREERGIRRRRKADVLEHDRTSFSPVEHQPDRGKLPRIELG